MKAVVLVRVEPGTERRVTEALGSLDGVADAFPAIGRPELVARVEIDGVEALGRLVSKVTEIDGVVVSETLLEIPQEALP